MSDILKAIEASAMKDVEADGMVWRLKKICSADLAEVGHAALAMSQGMEGPAKKGKGKAKGQSEEEVQAAIAGASKAKLKSMAQLKDAVTAAGLVAVGDAATREFVDVKATLDRNKADPDNGVIWVGSIPNHVADKLFEECLSLATDGGAAVERLHAFREQSRQSAGAGPDSEAVRNAPGAGS